MLTKLRAQTKFWMWIVGGAFILTIVFAWGMDFQGGGVTTTLGRVNGRKITIQEYQAALQQNYQIQRQQLGGMEIDDTMLQFVQEQTWQQLVNEILLIQELDRMPNSVSSPISRPMGSSIPGSTKRPWSTRATKCSGSR